MLAPAAAWSAMLCLLTSGTTMGFLDDQINSTSSPLLPSHNVTQSTLTRLKTPTTPTTTQKPSTTAVPPAVHTPTTTLRPDTTAVPPAVHTPTTTQRPHMTTGPPTNHIETRVPTMSMTSLAPQQTVATLMSATTSGSSEVCEDTMPSCYQYGRGPCNDPVYQSWARAHCALYCGFCPPPAIAPVACKNRVGNCGEYDNGNLCSSPAFYAWAYENCKGYCKFDRCGGSCTNSPNLDCLAVNQTTNICANEALARRLCSQFCGFCGIVDGNWAVWSGWSQCDVTCDNGTQVRTRTCTDPPPSPAQGSVPAGHPCGGPSRDTQTCVNDLCPVHGGWNSWSGWGECSVTCDVGMQRRDRHCDHPWPQRNGDHCFGEGAAYRICLPGACADGDWSSWGEWSNCSAECIRHRNRTCDNPPPSPLGRGCHGNHQDTEICYDDEPSNCTGGNNAPFIVFKARGVTDTSPAANQSMVFSTVLVNAGGGYSSSTGYFTAPVSGVYMFTVQMGATSTLHCQMHIIADGSIIGTISFRSSYRGLSTSGDGVAILSKGDRVYIRTSVGSTGNCIYQDRDDWSTFSGVLLNSGI